MTWRLRTEIPEDLIRGSKGRKSRDEKWNMSVTDQSGRTVGEEGEQSM